MTASRGDLAVGDAGKAREFGPITRTDIVRYAGAAGDFNPIHHDEPRAIALGLPSVFSIGMLQAGLLGTYVTDWLGAEGIRSLKVRFHQQVWPGDVLVCAGKVTAIDGSRIEVAVTCTRADGRLVVSGAASFARAKPAADAS